MNEENLELLSSIANGAGCLVHVELVHDKDCNNQTKAVILFFENRSLTITASDDDEIELIFEHRKWDDSYEIKNVTSALPWATVAERKLRWGWGLVNHQGYFDALQMEFANNIHQKQVIFQIVAIASHLKIYLLNEVSTEN